MRALNVVTVASLLQALSCCLEDSILLAVAAPHQRSRLVSLPPVRLQDSFIPDRKPSILLGVRGGSEAEKKGQEENESSEATTISEESSKSNSTTSSSGKSAKLKKAQRSLKKPSETTKKHLATKLKSSNANYRIQRELKEFLKSPPPNLSVQVGSNIRVWVVTMVGAPNTIYEGEVFKLRVSFPQQYPAVPPSVYFVQGYIPKHEHVYTNGDICLSLLGKDWRPTMTAQSIAVSILSILSSASKKTLPMDNAQHAGNKPGQYQKDWVYHDDNC